MRATALAFALTLIVGPALACTMYESAGTTSSTITAEAPIQTPVPTETKTGS